MSYFTEANLHRTEKPQWARIPSATWNKHQKRAYETKGWDTPGNRMTARGVVATIAGLALFTKNGTLPKVIGTGLVGYGRYCDISDGKIAEETGTKSPKGEAIDTVADKLLLATAGAFAVANRTIPPAEIAAIGVQQTANVLLTGVAKARKRPIHPGWLGKTSTAGIWMGVGSHLVGQTLETNGNERSADIFHKLGTGIALISTIVSAAGTIRDYAPAALGRITSDQSNSLNSMFENPLPNGQWLTGTQD